MQLLSHWHRDGGSEQNFGSLQRSVAQDDISVVGLWDCNGSCGRVRVLQLLAPSRRFDPAALPQRSSNTPRTVPQQPSYSYSH
ncbi:unnamed protein product [Leuciscus chuanchicus]